MNSLDEQTSVILRRYSPVLDDESPGSTLCINDLAFVRQAMVAVMTNYYGIGLQWGIDVDVLDKIKENHRRDAEARFTNTIAEWLINCKKGRPTWKAVVIAISATGAGENPAAAEKLAELCAKNGANSLSHVPQADGVDDTAIGLDDMGGVVLALGPVSAKWKEIGIILGARHDTLEGLYRLGESIVECINSVVKKWLKKKFDARFRAPSWKKLVEAIGAKTGGANAAHALEIAQQHLSKFPEAKKPCPGGAGNSSTEAEERTNGSTEAEERTNSSTEADTKLGMSSYNAVYGYLKVFGTEKLIQVGQLLGLDRMDLKRSTAKELLGDLITLWIRRDCLVEEESGDPTWRSLAGALLKANLTGISRDIQRDFHFSLH